MISSKPILFSGEMVRAILDNRKTQTRRIVKPQPENITPTSGIADEWYWLGGKRLQSVGYGALYVHTNLSSVINAMEKAHTYGERLWVKETHTIGDTCVVHSDKDDSWVDVEYRADDETKRCRGLSVATAEKCARWVSKVEVVGNGSNWKPSIFMPRWASRITLEITNVRVERLNEISEADAAAEGLRTSVGSGIIEGQTVYHFTTNSGYSQYASHAYQDLWESINGKGSWALNPWVWVIGFKRI